MEYTAALVQILEELKVKRFLITEGNLAAFLFQLNASTTTEHSHIHQFVEVLTDDEKPETLLRLIKKLFCDDFTFSMSKMLVFTTDTNVLMLQDYLEAQFSSLAAISPQILVLREDCTKLDRKNIINAFHSGILLLGEFSFADTQNKTGMFLLDIDGCSGSNFN
jgi:superfamily II DNA/RNA helicase